MVVEIADLAEELPDSFLVPHLRVGVTLDARVDPASLLPLLGDGFTYIAYGNGEPGRLDPDTATSDLLEAWIGGDNDDFPSDLDAEGIPAVVNTYGPGTHSWTYWDRELKASLPSIAKALGQRGESTSES